MGVRKVLGLNPLEYAAELVASADEKARLNEVQQRVDLYLENGERWTRQELGRLFSPMRRKRMEPFAPLADTQNLFSRVCDETADLVYAPPPVRTIYDAADGAGAGARGERSPGAGHDAFGLLAQEARWNRRMDLVCRLLGATAVAVHPRVTARLGLVLDVLTHFWVLPDPDDPTRELAVIYPQHVRGVGGRRETVYVYWDDAEAFKFSERGSILDGGIVGVDGKRTSRLTEANGHPGILPFVVAHGRERWGTYWDRTYSKALASADLTLKVLHCMTLRLHKTQGHQQLAISGSSVPRDQVLDEENPLFLGDDGAAAVLTQPTDTSHHLKTMEAVSLTAAAARGLSRDAMNAEAYRPSEARGLLQRRRNTVTVMAEFETRLVAVVAPLSAAHPQADHRMPASSRLAIDFAEVSAEGDRGAVLEIRKEEIAQGTRNYLDNVREDNPEITSEEEAAAELEHNLSINAKWLERFARMNQKRENNVAQPGQTAEDNGRMGSAVRDGELSKDDAAERASTTTDKETQTS